MEKMLGSQKRKEILYVFGFLIMLTYLRSRQLIFNTDSVLLVVMNCYHSLHGTKYINTASSSSLTAITYNPAAAEALVLSR